MEHLVRVQNQRDRRTLAWLRAQPRTEAVPGGDVSRLALTAPRFSAHRPEPSDRRAVAGQHPPILAARGVAQRPPGSRIAAEKPHRAPAR
jgi:hypothetical protein